MNKESITKEDKNSSSQYIKINNWIATFVFLFPFINGAIGIEGASLITLAIIVALFFVSLYHNNFKVKPLGISIFMLIVCMFCLSFLRMEQLDYVLKYFLYFGIFNMIALFGGMLPVDIKKVIEHMVLIGFVGILCYWVRGTTYENTGVQMATAYAVLGVFYASIMAILIRTKYMVFAVLNCLLVLFLHVKSAPRGIWISIAFYLAFLVFFILTYKLNKVKGMIVKISLIGIATVFIWEFIPNMERILLGINDFLIEKFDIYVYALWKFSFYLNKGDLFNGRSEIWGQAISIIREGGFWGKGIGYFESIMGGGHAHNILLQVLCETGIVFFIPVVFLLVKSICILVFMTNRVKSIEYLYFLVLFSYGVVMLFYSSAYWLWVPFWFCAGYFIGNGKKLFRVSRGNEL